MPAAKANGAAARLSRTLSDPAIFYGGLVSEQCDAAGDAEGGHPAAAIDVFFQVDVSDEGIGEEGERRGCGPDDADIAPRQSDQQAEEAEGHECEADHEASIGDHSAD